MTVAEGNNTVSEPRITSSRWFRTVTLLALLLFALFASNVLYVLIARPSDPLSGIPGELLYVATFDDFSDEWELYEGQQSAAISESRLRLAVASPQTASWSSASHQFAEFDISVTASASKGPIDNAFGIVFGMGGSDDDDCTLPAVILCALDDSLPLLGAAMGQFIDSAEGTDYYYAFLISSDGYYRLRQVQDGQQKVLSDWVPTSHIRQNLGTQNSIRVSAKGSDVTFFINGQQVMLCLPDDSASTSTFSSGECLDGSMHETYRAASALTGKLGVIVEATQTGGGGVVVEFDNVVVISPGYPSVEDAKA